MHLGKVTSVVIALALAGISHATAATQLYKVSANLSHDGKRIGSPSVIVKGGTNASVEVSGPNGYKLALKVTDAGKGQLKVVSHLTTTYGTIAPEMVVLAGQPATVSVGNIAITLTATRTDN